MKSSTAGVDLGLPRALSTLRAVGRSEVEGLEAPSLTSTSIGAYREEDGAGAGGGGNGGFLPPTREWRITSAWGGSGTLERDTEGAGSIVFKVCGGDVR